MADLVETFRTIMHGRAPSAGAKMESPVYPIPTACRTSHLHFGMVKSESDPSVRSCGETNLRPAIF